MSEVNALTIINVSELSVVHTPPIGCLDSLTHWYKTHRGMEPKKHHVHAFLRGNYLHRHKGKPRRNIPFAPNRVVYSADLTSDLQDGKTVLVRSDTTLQTTITVG